MGVKNATVNFAGIEKTASFLKVISFAGMENVKNAENVSDLYKLKNVERIYINDRLSFQFDVSGYENLDHLGAEYWKGLIGVDKCTNLTSLVLSKYTEKDLEKITSLKKLKILHIYNSAITTLKGLSAFKSLNELSLNRNNALEDIGEIAELKSLRKLIIEKCKNISDHSFLENMKGIEVLKIDKPK
jgi:internalin A